MQVRSVEKKNRFGPSEFRQIARSLQKKTWKKKNSFFSLNCKLVRVHFFVVLCLSLSLSLSPSLSLSLSLFENWISKFRFRCHAFVKITSSYSDAGKWFASFTSFCLNVKHFFLFFSFLSFNLTFDIPVTCPFFFLNSGNISI